jgi:hypothetical protein
MRKAKYFFATPDESETTTTATFSTHCRLPRPYLAVLQRPSGPPAQIPASLPVLATPIFFKQFRLFIRAIADARPKLPESKARNYPPFQATGRRF